MKKRIVKLAVLFIIAASFTACEDLFTNCETCRYNVYVDGIQDTTQTYGEAEYCGTELVGLKAAPPVTVGVTVTKFECD